MFKKVLLSVISMIILLSVLASCSAKTAITETEFSDLTAKAGYVMTNEAVRFSTNVTSSLQATSSDRRVVIDFYVFSSNDTARASFNSAVKSLDLISGNKSGSNYSAANYSLYSYTIDGIYYHYFRIDNTLVCVETDSKNKSAANEMLTTLGYK